MRQKILDNLTKREQAPRRFGWVLKPLGGGRYQVRLAGGRKIEVDGESGWRVGDGVLISNLRIVGRGSRFMAPPVYEV